MMLGGPNGDEVAQGDIEAAAEIAERAVGLRPKDVPREPRRVLLRRWVKRAVAVESAPRVGREDR